MSATETAGQPEAAAAGEAEGAAVVGKEEDRAPLWLDLRFSPAPERVYVGREEFASTSGGGAAPTNNFLSAVRFSPDGCCVATNSVDAVVRVWDLPPEAGEAAAAVAEDADSFAPALRLSESEAVYDLAWWPGMRADDPGTCCIATTSRGNPLHLWDTISGRLRATYRAYDDMDEITAAYSVAFSPDGSWLWAGYRQELRRFALGRPGRDCEVWRTHKRGERSGEGQPGILASLATSPDGSLLAAGSYQRTVGLYDAATGAAMAVLSGHSGGVTHLKFGADGNYLYSGARRDANILCWDVRHFSGAVYRLERASAGTNQRIAFDLDSSGGQLVSGGEDGIVRAYDLKTGEPSAKFSVAAHSAVAGVSLHPTAPFLATGSGHRTFPSTSDDSDSDEPCEPLPLENALSIWRCAHVWTSFEAMEA